MCTHETTTGKDKDVLCAADWESHLPPVCTKLDEFSQSTLGARVPKCPAATMGVPPPRQHAETKKAGTRSTYLPERIQNGKPHFNPNLSQCKDNDC